MLDTELSYLNNRVMMLYYHTMMLYYSVVLLYHSVVLLYLLYGDSNKNLKKLWLILTRHRTHVELFKPFVIELKSDVISLWVWFTLYSCMIMSWKGDCLIVYWFLWFFQFLMSFFRFFLVFCHSTPRLYNWYWNSAFYWVYWGDLNAPNGWLSNSLFWWWFCHSFT